MKIGVLDVETRDDGLLYCHSFSKQRVHDFFVSRNVEKHMYDDGYFHKSLLLPLVMGLGHVYQQTIEDIEDWLKKCTLEREYTITRTMGDETVDTMPSLSQVMEQLTSMEQKTRQLLQESREERLTGVGERIHNIEKRLTDVGERSHNIKKRLADVDESTRNLKKRFTDMDEILTYLYQKAKREETQ